VAEKHIQGDCEDWAEERGIFVRRVLWNGRRAAPDDIVISNGRHIWVEFKDLDGKLSKLQEIEHERMRAAGADVQVIKSFRAFQRLFN
jgi:hypothetical protein